MTDRMWEATTNHARTCATDDKVYAHSTPHGTIYVDSVFNVVRVDIGGAEWPLHQLNRGQTVSRPPSPNRKEGAERQSSMDFACSLTRTYSVSGPGRWWCSRCCRTRTSTATASRRPNPSWSMATPPATSHCCRVSVRLPSIPLGVLPPCDSPAAVLTSCARVVRDLQTRCRRWWTHRRSGSRTPRRWTSPSTTWSPSPKPTAASATSGLAKRSTCQVNPVVPNKINK